MMTMSRSKKTSIATKVRALLKQGVEYAEIARKLDCSYQYVWHIGERERMKGVVKRKPNKYLSKAMEYLKKAMEEDLK